MAPIDRPSPTGHFLTLYLGTTIPEKFSVCRVADLFREENAVRCLRDYDLYLRTECHASGMLPRISLKCEFGYAICVSQSGGEPARFKKGEGYHQ